MLNSRNAQRQQSAQRPGRTQPKILSAAALAAAAFCCNGLPLIAQQAPALRFESVDGPAQAAQLRQSYAQLQQPQRPQAGVGAQQPQLQQADVPMQQPAEVQLTQDGRPLPAQVLHVATEQDELSIIQRRSQLLTTRSNILRTAIADPSVIDMVQYSPNEVAIIGLEVGSTTLTMWFEDSPEPLIYLVKTIPDPSIEERQRIDYGKLEQKLGVVFPDSKVYLIPLSGKILVKGQARDSKEAADILEIIRGEVINQTGNLPGPQPQAAANAAGLQSQVLNPLDLASTMIVNMLEIPGEFQVSLRVRIAELSRSQLRRAGIDFEYLINDGRHAVQYGLGGTPATVAGLFENGEINFLINALESNGTTKILAEPVLTVLSGHSASFLSGGEFAVPTVVGIGGAQGQQTTFRGFGTSLLVTPIVLDKDLIRMTIVPEFSQINSENSVGDIPGVDTRRAQTTVELREGQTIAIAGLVSNQTDTQIARIPFLSELPYVGSRFFSSKSATQDQTELLILVTPELVRPMDPDQVPPVPGFEVTSPNDYELYHAAMSEGVPDTGVYQLAPYGSGSSYGINVGYNTFNPAPATPLYSPMPTNPYGGVQLIPAPGHKVPPAGANPPQRGPAPPAQVPAKIPQHTMRTLPRLQPPEAASPVSNSSTRPGAAMGPSASIWGQPAPQASADSRATWMNSNVIPAGAATQEIPAVPPQQNPRISFFGAR